MTYNSGWIGLMSVPSTSAWGFCSAAKCEKPRVDLFIQRDLPYSIAQMPVPVPKSSTRVGWSIGASANLPLNSRVQIWCCRSMCRRTRISTGPPDPCQLASSQTYRDATVLPARAGDVNSRKTRREMDTADSLDRWASNTLRQFEVRLTENNTQRRATHSLPCSCGMSARFPRQS